MVAAGRGSLWGEVGRSPTSPLFKSHVRDCTSQRDLSSGERSPNPVRSVCSRRTARGESQAKRSYSVPSLPNSQKNFKASENNSVKKKALAGLTILAFLCISTPVYPQKTKPNSADLAPLSVLEKKYDRFEDKTTVWIYPQRLYIKNLSYRELRITAFFTYRGKAAGAQIEKMGLQFISTSREWTYLRKNNLIALIDGERLSIGRPSAKESDISTNYTGIEVEEILEFEVTYQDLKKLAYANEVEMRLGPAEFNLYSSFLRSIRTLISGLAPPVVSTKKRAAKHATIKD